MKITIRSSKHVKPAYSAAHPPPTSDAEPLTVFDKANFDTDMSVIYAFRPPFPAHAALEDGLARALAEYPEWAGRLGEDARGARAILLNDEGARLVEAAAEGTLDSAMPLNPTPEVRSLHPTGDGAVELMMIQVTRFACGSVVVGFTTQHIVADGRATNNFFLAWSQATRGAAISPAPVRDRAAFFKPRAPPRVEFEHRGVEFTAKKPAPADDQKPAPEDEVVVHKAHFTREFVSRLKSRASAGAHRPYSTLQCVVAHLWRSMTKARGLAGGETTHVRIAVDGRMRMNPPVPDGYTGNVVLWAFPATTAQDLIANPVQHAVELINRAVSRVDDSYFKSFIDFANSGVVEAEGLAPTADAAEMVLCPDLEVDSWLRIPFYDLDFGGGRPFFFMPTFLPVEGLLILLPSCFGDGSVDAYVPLFSRNMDTFKNCCYSLD